MSKQVGSSSLRTVIVIDRPPVPPAVPLALPAAPGGPPRRMNSALDTILTGLGFVELISFEKQCENYRFTES